jgi:hypothetical protein
MAITTSGTTLTFNDATTQTTAPVNTNANVNSVAAGTGISVSATTGALTVTNSGVTSIVAGTGISISGATGAVTVTNSSPGAVTSVNGLTGAVVDTTLDSIGSVIWAANITTSSVAGGSTIAGSNLRYASTISEAGNPTNVNGYFSEGTNAGSNPKTTWFGINTQRSTNGNTGYTNPGGSTALSGTWRAMGGCCARSSYYSPCDNQTNSQSCVALFVRVS